MKDSEYIKATNKDKIDIAIKILRDVYPDTRYGVSRKELAVIISKLEKARRRLVNLLE